MTFDGPVRDNVIWIFGSNMRIFIDEVRALRDRMAAERQAKRDRLAAETARLQGYIDGTVRNQGGQS